RCKVQSIGPCSVSRNWRASTRWHPSVAASGASAVRYPGCADERLDGRHRSLSANVDTGRWHCHRCGAGGLRREKWPRREPRYNPKRASSRRAFTLGPVPPAVESATTTRIPGPHVRQDTWRELFAGAPQIAEDPAGAYLESRGIPHQIAAVADVRYVAR